MYSLYYQLCQFNRIKKNQFIYLIFFLPLLVGSVYAQSEDSDCNPPFLTFADEITTTSAEIYWISFTGESQWEVAYGKAGFVPGGEGSKSVIVSSERSTTITGLEGSTDYEFSIRAICSSSNKSEWTQPFAFSTKCLPLSIPFVEDFESGYTTNTYLKGCWLQTNDSGPWMLSEELGMFNLLPRSGDLLIRYCGRSDFYFSGTDCW